MRALFLGFDGGSTRAQEPFAQLALALHLKGHEIVWLAEAGSAAALLAQKLELPNHTVPRIRVVGARRTLAISERISDQGSELVLYQGDRTEPIALFSALPYPQVSLVEFYRAEKGQAVRQKSVGGFLARTVHRVAFSDPQQEERSLESIRFRARGGRRVVFVDRDGTLNAEVGPIRVPGDLEILPGVGEGLRALDKGDYQIVVITNQAAVGRGDLTLAQLDCIHGRLRELLRREGIEISAIYSCPHTPQAECDCRKPEPGLILQAAGDLGIRMEESWVIGDSMRDIGAGQSIGIPSILVKTGWGGADPRAAELEGKFTPAQKARDFTAASEWILRHESRPRVRRGT